MVTYCNNTSHNSVYQALLKCWCNKCIFFVLWFSLILLTNCMSCCSIYVLLHKIMASYFMVFGAIFLVLWLTLLTFPCTYNFHPCLQEDRWVNLLLNITNMSSLHIIQPYLVLMIPSCYLSQLPSPHCCFCVWMYDCVNCIFLFFFITDFLFTWFPFSVLLHCINGTIHCPSLLIDLTGIALLLWASSLHVWSSLWWCNLYWSSLLCMIGHCCLVFHTPVLSHGSMVYHLHVA